MKILFIGDYSNLHACLATELRRQGHRTFIISDGGGYQLTQCDVNLDRERGSAGAIRYLYRIFSLLPRLKGFDVVQFINPHFFKLRPGKLRYLLRQIRQDNGPLFLTLAGNDYFFVDACIRRGIFGYNEFRIGTEPTPFDISHPERARQWLAKVNADYDKEFYDTISGAMSVLYEYDAAARPLLSDRLAYTGIPIDTASLAFSPLPEGKTTLLIGKRPGMEDQKGTNILEIEARKIEAEMPGKVSIDVVEGGLSLNAYHSRLRNAHIVLDQLYAYTPATNALSAMALGRVAASGAQSEFYSFIGEEQMRPVVALNPLDNDWKQELRRLAADREGLQARAAESRRFVEKHNAAPTVAKRFLNHWEKWLR